MGQSEEQKAFMEYARYGIESKALSAGDDAAGGYLAPAEFVAELDKDLIEFSPVRAAARVGQTTRGSVMLPKRTTAMEPSLGDKLTLFAAMFPPRIWALCLIGLAVLLGAARMPRCFLMSFFT